MAGETVVVARGELVWLSVLTAVVCGVAVLLLSRSIRGSVLGHAMVLQRGVQATLSSSQLLSRNSQIEAEGAGEEAASIEETGASLQELSTMTERNAGSARDASRFARGAREAAEGGIRDMQALAQAMDGIQHSGDDVAKIVKTIDEIAFQTNILALNAAVEAARAGESGLGFAVVAEEVRALAQRSSTAARDTASKIQEAITRTGHGVTLSRKVGEALDEIVAKARSVDELAGKVAHASQEQMQGIAQINTAVGEMGQITQRNAANAEEVAQVSNRLTHQAAELKGSIQGLLILVSADSAKSFEAASPSTTPGDATSAGASRGHTTGAVQPQLAESGWR